MGRKRSECRVTGGTRVGGKRRECRVVGRESKVREDDGRRG